MFPQKTVILVVEDSDHMRKLIKEELADNGYDQILEACDGKEALTQMKKADKGRTPVGLIVADWMMPKMTGLEFLKSLKTSKKWKEIPFIMVTALGDMDKVASALAVGVSNYIVKPLEKGVLIQKMNEAYAKLTKPQKSATSTARALKP